MHIESVRIYWEEGDAEFEAVLADELLDACTGGSQAPIADFRSSWPSSGKGQTSGG